MSTWRPQLDPRVIPTIPGLALPCCRIDFIIEDVLPGDLPKCFLREHLPALSLHAHAPIK